MCVSLPWLSVQFSIIAAYSQQRPAIIQCRMMPSAAASELLMACCMCSPAMPHGGNQQAMRQQCWQGTRLLLPRSQRRLHVPSPPTSAAASPSLLTGQAPSALPCCLSAVDLVLAARCSNGASVCMQLARCRFSLTLHLNRSHRYDQEPAEALQGLVPGPLSLFHHILPHNL